MIFIFLHFLLVILLFADAPKHHADARGGFLPRHDDDLREPLVRCQGSQVSMRVARGSVALSVQLLLPSRYLFSPAVYSVSGPLLSCVWNLRVFPDDRRAEETSPRRVSGT